MPLRKNSSGGSGSKHGCIELRSVFLIKVAHCTVRPTFSCVVWASGIGRNGVYQRLGIPFAFFVTHPLQHHNPNDATWRATAVRNPDYEVQVTVKRRCLRHLTADQVRAATNLRPRVTRWARQFGSLKIEGSSQSHG